MTHAEARKATEEEKQRYVAGLLSRLDAYARFSQACVKELREFQVSGEPPARWIWDRDSDEI